jgi:hypothetical protein
MPTIEISEEIKKRVDAVKDWLPADSYDEILEFMIDGLDMDF